MLPADIAGYVAKHFAPAEQAPALALLAGAKQQDGSSAEPRMLRCALFTCDNTLAGLEFEISWLASDSRDVIMSAEFVRQEGNWVQVRDLSVPFTANG